MISIHFQGKPFTITVIQVYTPTNNAEEAEVEQLHDHLPDLLELTPRINKNKNRYTFIVGDWNAKVGSYEIPGVTGKFGLGMQNEAGPRLTVFPRERTGHSNLFQQHKRRLYTWTAQEGQHRNQSNYISCTKDGEALYSQQKQDLELSVAQIMNSFCQIKT